jgi:peptide/nickel transport system substrate-binding protein
MVARPARHRLPRRRLLTTSTALLGAAALGSCGRSAGSPSTPTASSAAKPKTGGDFTWAQQIDPFDYDPTGKVLQNGPWIELGYNSLLSIKHGAGVGYTDLVSEPSLAEKWETPDAQTFTFHLRQGAKWQNLSPVNGRPVTADDVRFSMEYQSRTGAFKDSKIPTSINVSMYEGLDSVQTPDASTAVVKFKQPFVPFLQHMSLERNAILAHEVFDKEGSFSNTMVGTGPWQLDPGQSQQGTRWAMVRNPNYFLTGRPYIDRVNILVLKDNATMVSAFQTKQIDLLNQQYVTPANAPQIARANPTAVDYPFNDTRGGLLFENVKKPPLDDIRIRKAIALSIDRDAFLKTFYDGKGEWAVAGGQPGLFTHDEIHSLLKYDPAQAKQLVADAGFPNGVNLELHYSPARGDMGTQIVQLIQAQLKDGNLNVTLKPEDEATFSDSQRKGQFQLDYEVKPQVGDIDAYIFYNWYSKSNGNFGGVNDSNLDALLESQRSTVDPAKRSEILRQAVRLIVDNGYYTAFCYGQGHFFWQPFLKNFAPNIAHNTMPVYDSWIDKS